jgi:tetratricopeptide (TPR) repeat protein
MAKAYQRENQLDKAVENYKKALEINPDLLSSQFALALVYLYGKSQPNDAIPYFQKVTERSKIPQAYYGLGMAYSLAGYNAEVLDVITELRAMGQNDLAGKLEERIRLPYQPGPVTSPTPPVAAQSASKPSSLVPSTPPAPPAPTTSQIKLGTPEGVTKVRLRGKMFNTGPKIINNSGWGGGGY